MKDMFKEIFFVIPAYKPDDKIFDVIDGLKSLGFNKILVVRDGGGEEYDEIFSRIVKRGCILQVHEDNMGKGVALKTAFKYIIKNFSDSCAGVVTADADGQHLPSDIARIADELQNFSDSLVLGVRKFEKTVPLRSRFGNILTQKIFKIVTGKAVSDTQTGLRGIPISLLSKFVELSGEGYEYEINMLASVKKLDFPIVEVSIETVYIENNRSSHFNPILDSIKIYSLLLRFGLSGLISFVADYRIFVVSFSLTGSLIFASYFARSISMFLNFALNKKMVFCFQGRELTSFLKYLCTCILSITISYFVLLGVYKFSDFSIYYAKIIIEILLFFLNFYIQRVFVFKKNSQ